MAPPGYAGAACPIRAHFPCGRKVLSIMTHSPASRLRTIRRLRSRPATAADEPVDSPRDATDTAALPAATSASASPQADGGHRLPPAAASTVLAAVMWPMAIFSFVHKVLLIPQNKHTTDDFTTVWAAVNRFTSGVPVYSENYATVDPHYLYFPGGTLLLSPMALLPEASAGRFAYVLANGLAIVAALAVLTVLFGFSLRGGVWPTAIFGLFATEAVFNTLLFSNNNGLLLLLMVGFLALMLRGRRVAAGILIGLAITVKPQFLPLLALPFVRRQFSTVIAGLAVPILFNLAAWPLMVDPGAFFSVLLPYLGEVRDYANSSIPGVVAYFGLPAWVSLVWRGIAAVCVLAALAGLWTQRKRDELMWAASSACVLLIGVFLISGLGQMYYSMLLVPLLFTVTRVRSAMHNPVAWAGVYWCLSSDVWQSDRWFWPSRVLEYARGTAGWSLLLIAIAASAVVWALADRRSSDPTTAAAEEATR